MVRRTLKKFAQLSAPGPTGLRVAQLLEALDGVTFFEQEVILSGLVCWITDCGNGNLPDWSAQMVALKKKTGGLRPIAFGKTLRRLTSKLMLHGLISKIVAHLSPLQVGVGIKGATELLARQLMRRPKNDPRLCVLSVLQVDMSNAFNELDRQQMLDKLDKAVPELSNWVHYTYGYHAFLFLGKNQMTSQQGTQQGDPLGPALFAIALQGIISKLQVLQPLSWQAWFLDDGLILGRYDELVRVVKFLQEHCRMINLRVNLKKCLIWSPTLQPRQDCPVTMPMLGASR